mmetsp:Transcript_29606/g.81421  ORF Transcript_29606/g.81421 Transcript_29606/m.81421 type:complete len:287 (-) Transcript_29606:189-1049(-)
MGEHFGLAEGLGYVPRSLVVQLEHPVDHVGLIEFDDAGVADTAEGPDQSLDVGAAVALLLAAKTLVQHQAQGPRKRQQHKLDRPDQRRHSGCKEELLRPSEDGRWDDLAKNEHNTDRKKASQPSWHELVKEQWQSFIGCGIGEQQGNQEVVLVRRVHSMQVPCCSAPKIMPGYQGEDLPCMLLVVQQPLLSYRTLRWRCTWFNLLGLFMKQYLHFELVNGGEAKCKPRGQSSTGNATECTSQNDPPFCGASLERSVLSGLIGRVRVCNEDLAVTKQLFGFATISLL